MTSTRRTIAALVLGAVALLGVVATSSPTVAVEAARRFDPQP